MAVESNLVVNDIPIKLDYFVGRFVDHTFSGMVESLDDTGPVHDLIYVMEDKTISINLNGANIPVNEFVTKIFVSTTNGILAPLKGVTQPVRKVKLTIKK